MRSRIQTIPAYRSDYKPLHRGDRLADVRRWSRWMDSQFEVPGTNIKFGLDPILGLFLPGLGSVGSAVVSLALISAMNKQGASGHVMVRMLINVLIDTTFGAIPIIGNVFDFFFRANDRNVELLRRHYEEGRYQGNGRGLLLAAVGMLLLIGGLLVWGAVAAVSWLWHAMT